MDSRIRGNDTCEASFGHQTQMNKKAGPQAALPYLRASDSDRFLFILFQQSIEHLVMLDPILLDEFIPRHAVPDHNQLAVLHSKLPV